MQADGPKHERETIIRFDEESETCSIWTASQVIYRKLLKRLGSDYLVEDGERHAEFKCPVKFTDLPRRKVKKVLDPRLALQRRDHLAKARQVIRRGEIKQASSNGSPIS